MAYIEQYLKYNEVYYSHARRFFEEFNYNIYNMHGRCVDVGCNVGDITFDVFSPFLRDTALLYGKFL